MRKPRFGIWNSAIHFGSLFGGVLLIVASTSEDSSLLTLALCILWIVIVTFAAEKLLFVIKKEKYKWRGYSSMLVAFNSIAIHLYQDGNNGNLVMLEPKTTKGKNVIRIHESHMSGSDKTVDGVDGTNVSLLAGMFRVRRIDEGFLVEWDSKDHWKVSGEKK